MKYLFLILAILLMPNLAVAQPATGQPPSYNHLVDWAERYEDTEQRENIIRLIEERLENESWPLKEEQVFVLQATLNRLKLVGMPLEISALELSGDNLSLKDYEGKVVLVDFWASWCGPCMQEISKIKPIRQKYKENFDVVGVNLDESRLDAITAKIRVNIPWKNFAYGEKTAEIVKQYNITSIPRGVLLDKQGNVVRLDVHSSELETEIKKLLEK